MSPMPALTLPLLLASSAALAAGSQIMKSSDCYQQHLALGQKSANPGVGTDPKTIEPFVTVSKDGFYAVECIKDYMFYSGDKFGDHRQGYKIADVSNVSIVHYDAHVPKEDQKKMTPAVCFSFCRTLPDMLYFGLQNGRGCYCAPYYKMEAGDSSQCDATCPGDASQTCGGKSKSSIFEMHSCDDMAEVFSKTSGDTSKLAGDLKQFAEKVKTAAADMTSQADQFQKNFGKAGDPAASELMQSAKVFAGEMQHEAEAAEALGAKNEKLGGEAAPDFKSSKGADKADALIGQMEAGLKEMKASNAALNTTYGKAVPYEDLGEPATAGKQYYPAMYFVDKKHADDPSTCSGKSVGEPIYGMNFDECAMACDANVHDCVGFSFFRGMQANSLCFLFSKFTTATHYTGCGKKASFLQREEPAHGETTACFAKLSKFEGTTLKPNPSGKCEQCFTKVTEASRCFE